MSTMNPMSSVNNITLNTCENVLVTGPAALTRTVDTSKDCINAISILSLLIVFVGIAANIVNIIVYTKGVKYSPRVRFLLTLSIIDFSILVLQIPQLVISSEQGQILSTHRASYGGYAILNYSFGFILTTCSAWTVVAMVIHHWVQTRNDDEMTDVLSNEMNAENTDEFTTKEFRTSNIAIAIVAFVSIAIHIIKMFEYTVNSDMFTPSLLVKRSSLQTHGYEIYSLLINVFVSFAGPFLFLFGTCVYYLVIRIKLRSASDPSPCGEQLLFSLSGLYIITHILSMYTYFAPIISQSYTSKLTCLMKVDELLSLIYMCFKFVLYLMFYEVYKFCLKKRFRNGKEIWLNLNNKPQSTRFAMVAQADSTDTPPDTCFENPVYGAMSDDLETSQQSNL